VPWQVFLLRKKTGITDVIPVFLAGAEGLEVATQPPPKHSRPARLQRFALLLVLSYHRLASSATGGASAVLPGTLRVPSGSLIFAKKKTVSVETVFFWQGQKDLNPRHAVLEFFQIRIIVYYC
jgi:hypothetical protein